MLKIRTAAAIAGALGTVIAAGMLLDRASATNSTTTAKAPEPAKAHCGTKTAKANAKLEHGKLDAAMSAGTLLRGAGGEAYASFDISTTAIANSTRPDLNLAIVIDHSGSMSDGRIDHAKSAAIGIVDRLGDKDRVALVQYDDVADVLVPSIATDAAGKRKLRDAINAISLGGGTNLDGGMTRGHEEVQRTYSQNQVSRVILLSDGRANQGVVDPIQIAGHARDAANKGVRTTSVGIGLDFNEDLMEAIAESGRGQYHYVKASSDLDKVIAGELDGIQATVATNVELRLKPACAGVEIKDVLGYESRRDGDTVVIPMADLFGGDSRNLLVKLAVPDGDGAIGTLAGELVYRDAKGGEVKRATVALGVERTTDTAIASASVDGDVMARVLQLEAAQSMRTAAQAYERGDREGAIRTLEASQRQIQEKGVRYKVAPAKTAPAMAELSKMTTDTKAYDPSSSDGKDMVKATKSKARVMSKKAEK